MNLHKAVIYLVAAFVVVALKPTVIEAAPPIVTDGQAYVVQADDWLGTLADKFYGNPLAYPVIVEATNAIAVQNERYAPVDDPDQVTIGQVLFVPALDDIPDALLAEAPLAKAQPSAGSIVSTVGPTAEQAQLLASLEAKGRPPELLNEVWLNSDPLKLAELQGQVVIVEFWTFG
jgi:hypothetical protein